MGILTLVNTFDPGEYGLKNVEMGGSLPSRPQWGVPTPYQLILIEGNANILSGVDIRITYGS